MFKQHTIPKRKEMVKRCNLCFNWSRVGHQTGDCKSNSRCKDSQAVHHTRLHGTKIRDQTTHRSRAAPALESFEGETVSHASNSINTTLLPTARVTVIPNGEMVVLLWIMAPKKTLSLKGLCGSSTWSNKKPICKFKKFQEATRNHASSIKTQSHYNQLQRRIVCTTC